MTEVTENSLKKEAGEQLVKMINSLTSDNIIGTSRTLVYKGQRYRLTIDKEM